MDARKIDAMARRFEGADARGIVAWAGDAFASSVALSSSFQMQSLPLLHIVSEVTPELPIIFLDTGYHFPETLAFRDRLVRQWGLNLRVVRAAVSRREFVDRHGDDLHRRDPDLCCYINKVEPMKRAMASYGAWISGIRRDQSSARRRIRVVEQSSDGTVRIHPMAEWTSREIWRYISEHELPEHPLLAQGYMSVGCAPCTRPVYDGEDERAGRWPGTRKAECGLHTVLRAAGPTSTRQEAEDADREAESTVE